jgi:hypothetical protein
MLQLVDMIFDETVHSLLAISSWGRRVLPADKLKHIGHLIAIVASAMSLARH